MLDLCIYFISFAGKQLDRIQWVHSYIICFHISVGLMWSLLKFYKCFGLMLLLALLQCILFELHFDVAYPQNTFTMSISTSVASKYKQKFHSIILPLNNTINSTACSYGNSLDAKMFYQFSNSLTNQFHAFYIMHIDRFCLLVINRSLQKYVKRTGLAAN